MSERVAPKIGDRLCVWATVSGSSDITWGWPPSSSAGSAHGYERASFVVTEVVATLAFCDLKGTKWENTWPDKRHGKTVVSIDWTHPYVEIFSPKRKKCRQCR